MKLCRSVNNRMLAGVCGGLAEHLGWSPSRLRVVWVAGTLSLPRALVLNPESAVASTGV
jgi:phage shock protein PspC (stress-responsive transcriptional regulator)